MRQKYSKIVYAVLLICLITSCNSNKLDVDVSGVKADVKIRRFDRDLFEMDTTHYPGKIRSLQQKYPDIFRVFMDNLYSDYFRRYPKGDSEAVLAAWETLFNRNKYMLEVYHDASKIYTDTEVKKLDDGLNEAMKHYRFYFPKDTLPQFTTLISSFGYKCFSTETKDICICLDMFLGEKYKYYTAQNIDFPDYLSRRLKKEYIVPEAIKTIFSMKYDERDYTDKTLLSEAIYMGKNLYFLDAMAPKMEDTLKIEYSKQQLKWCRDNEKEIWGYMSGKDIFFKTDQNDKIKFMQDGPFTNAEGMPQESAPRLGEWLGWQIVRKYMDTHPEVTLARLFADKDYKKILLESKYRPRK